MKRFLLILLVLLIGCKKEKSFADDIVLSFPKDEKLTFQQFNEDMDEMGTALIYIGKESTNIDVKYYKYILPPPPPPPKINQTKEKYLAELKKFEDSAKVVNKQYFNSETLQILETKESLYDSLSNKNFSVVVREKDTIPFYRRNFETDKIKKYKAYPVFIKNISNKVMKIPIETQIVSLYVLNNNQFQYVRNSDYLICGTGLSSNSYFELKPKEILIYSYPHLKKGHKRKGKISFHKATSKEFEISIDEKIIKNQRSIHYLQ